MIWGVPLFLETPTWVKCSHFFFDDGIIWEAYELHRNQTSRHGPPNPHQKEGLGLGSYLPPACPLNDKAGYENA